MVTSSDKVMELAAAVRRYIVDGSHISIGGFTINRNPMAAIYEIIRQKIRRLHLYAHSNGQGVDELVGAGCLERIEIAYAGSGRFAPTCIRFRKAVESGVIAVEDYSNYQMTLRFQAGAMGVPFLPTRSSLGTSIIEKWGFGKALRRKADRLPDKKLTVIDNPFGSWMEVSKVVLVPAITPDVTLIHAQMADAKGTTRIEGLTFADVEQAKAAKHVIVTCERVVEPGILRENPDQNQIPFFNVDAVVPVKFGAYPTACYRHYDYDPAYLNAYRQAALDDRLYAAYLEDHVFSLKTHAELMDRIGDERLAAIKADKQTGYAINLDRK